MLLEIPWYTWLTIGLGVLFFLLAPYYRDLTERVIRPKIADFLVPPLKGGSRKADRVVRVRKD